MRHLLYGSLLLLALAGCTTGSKVDAPEAGAATPPVTAALPAPAVPPTTPPATSSARGGYYKDDGPGVQPPPVELATVPDAVPQSEPLHRFANRPYRVFGKDYVPITSPAPFRQAGLGSWYGRRFHGMPTSSGEPYDMYAMTAAHPTLPIPSYARITNPANGRSVVVRINDRGPFHSNRIIDLSYTAAWKLGYIERGSTRLEVESLPASEAPTLQAQAPVEQGGVFLQLGAFTAREAAENLRARVQRELAWLSETLQVVTGGALYRLHLGPYRSHDEARSIAERIRAELSLRPVIVGK
jgi:peptidoglycan lytic transglycosylase